MCGVFFLLDALKALVTPHARSKGGTWAPQCSMFVWARFWQNNSDWLGIGMSCASWPPRGHYKLGGTHAWFFPKLFLSTYDLFLVAAESSVARGVDYYVRNLNLNSRSAWAHRDTMSNPFSRRACKPLSLNYFYNDLKHAFPSTLKQFSLLSRFHFRGYFCHYCSFCYCCYYCCWRCCWRRVFSGICLLLIAARTHMR